MTLFHTRNSVVIEAFFQHSTKYERSAFPAYNPAESLFSIVCSRLSVHCGGGVPGRGRPPDARLRRLHSPGDRKKRTRKQLISFVVVGEGYFSRSGGHLGELDYLLPARGCRGWGPTGSHTGNCKTHSGSMCFLGNDKISLN